MGSSLANVVFAASALLGLAVFAAIVLPGDGLSGARFAVAAAAILVVTPGGGWLAGRRLPK